MTTEFAPGRVLRAVPLFPLPEVVFFPGTRLPLHVFEPRYRTMAEHVLQAESPLLAVGFVPEDAEAPAPIVGVGTVVEHTRLADGRFNLVVQGEARVRVRELPFVPPYRRADLIVLGSTDFEAARTAVPLLVSAATRFLALASGGNAAFDFELPQDSNPGAIADLCAHQLVVDPVERQRVLNALDVAKRIRICAQALATQTAMVETERVLH